MSVGVCAMCLFFFFFKQNTAYEMRISDWSSDVCSSDLYDEPAAIDLAVDRFELRRRRLREREDRGFGEAAVPGGDLQRVEQSLDGMDAQRKAQIGRASCRERVCTYV